MEQEGAGGARRGRWGKETGGPCHACAGCMQEAHQTAGAPVPAGMQWRTACRLTRGPATPAPPTSTGAWGKRQCAALT